MKKTDITKLFAFGAVALASSFACAQTASAPTSSVQLWGIVDVAYRHTNNEGASKDRADSKVKCNTCQPVRSADANHFLALSPASA